VTGPNPADPAPEPAAVGSPEGADRLRAALEDLETEPREET